VRTLESRRACGRPGKNYYPDPAGSGKSNSIAVARAPSVEPADDQDRRYSIRLWVITDRIVLNRQLQDTIYQFEHKQGVVQKIMRIPATGGGLKTRYGQYFTTLQKIPLRSQENRGTEKRAYRDRG